MLTTNLGGSLVVLVLVSWLGVRLRDLGTLLLEEFGLRDGWESSSLVDDRSLVDLLVDGLDVVDSGGLNSLTLDDRLDGLVDVVVLVSTNVGTQVGGGALSVGDDLLVPVLGALLVELGLVLREHVLLVLSLDCGGGAVDMLGGEDLVVFNGLDTVLQVSGSLLIGDQASLLGGGGCASHGRWPRRSRRAPVGGLAPERPLGRSQCRPKCQFPILCDGQHTHLSGVSLVGSLKEVLDTGRNGRRHC